MSQFSSIALPQIGSFALLLALGLAGYSFVVGALALIIGGPGSERLGETARRAGIAAFGTILLASVVLVTAAFTDDFSVAYIFHHSNKDLPGPYKFAVLWSGQEGSLLFWSLLLAAYGFVLRLRYKTDPRLFAYASVVLAGVQIFFLSLVNFAARPFGLLDGPMRPDGSGLNPLLHYPELAILGTFLTRSGVISSVHAFAQSDIGKWFAWFLGLTLVVFLVFFFKNKSHLKSEHKLESLVSRESSFLFNNLLFVLLCFTVLWGTWFPKISEWVQDKKVTVGAPFYNNVAIPVTLLLLLLTAVGPLLAWRKTSLESLKRNFLWPTLGAIAVAIFLIITPESWGSIFGLKPWKDLSYFYSLMVIALSVLVTLTVASEFYRGGRVISKHTGQGMFASMVQLTHRNTRRYGGYIVHFGVVAAMIGFSGAALNQEKEMEMGYGDKMTIGNYELICRSFTQDDGPNYASEWAILDINQKGKNIGTLTP